MPHESCLYNVILQCKTTSPSCMQEIIPINKLYFNRRAQTTLAWSQVHSPLIIKLCYSRYYLMPCCPLQQSTSHDHHNDEDDRALPLYYPSLRHQPRWCILSLSDVILYISATSNKRSFTSSRCSSSSKRSWVTAATFLLTGRLLTRT